MLQDTLETVTVTYWCRVEPFKGSQNIRKWKKVELTLGTDLGVYPTVKKQFPYMVN